MCCAAGCLVGMRCCATEPEAGRCACDSLAPPGLPHRKPVDSPWIGTRGAGRGRGEGSDGRPHLHCWCRSTPLLGFHLECGTVDALETWHSLSIHLPQRLLAAKDPSGRPYFPIIHAPPIRRTLSPSYDTLCFVLAAFSELLIVSILQPSSSKLFLSLADLTHKTQLAVQLGAAEGSPRVSVQAWRQPARMEVAEVERLASGAQQLELPKLQAGQLLPATSDMLRLHLKQVAIEKRAPEGVKFKLTKQEKASPLVHACQRQAGPEIQGTELPRMLHGTSPDAF